LIAQGIDERYRWMDEVTAHLSDEESATITQALNILTGAVKKLENETEN
jgi:hypothetical protein